MIVFRLSQKVFSKEITGVGAELYGGRWNNKGRRVIYTCENRALCAAEIAVHTPLGIIPNNYFLQTIQLPKTKQFVVNRNELPNTWKNFPHHSSSKKIGDQFLIENEFLVMKVPSAIVQDEFNYLINPNHQLFKKVKIVKIEAFEFDIRLFDR